MNINIHRQQSPSFRRIYFLLITLLVTCFFPRPATAQIMEMFSKPIGSKQLMIYADRLDLSIDQRLALEPMHDSYLQIFRDMRDEDMQDFINILYDTATGVARSGFSIPQRSVLEDIVHDFVKIEKKIAATDKSLFNEIESLLNDQQHIRLVRVRKQRRIDALRTIVLEIGGEFNPGAQIDLTFYVENLNLSEDEKTLVYPILISYESTLLAKARKLHRAIQDGTVTILDAIDEMGIRDLAPEELIQLGNDEDFQLSIEALFDEASIEFQKATFELSQLNLKTLRKVLQQLQPQNKNDLRDKYYQRVYRRVLDQATAWRRRYDDALKYKTLPAELIEPITQTRDNVAMQQDTLIEKIVDAVEKSREFRTIDMLNNNNMGPKERAIEELQSQSGSIALRAIQELESLLGPELLADLSSEKESLKAQQPRNPVQTIRNGRVVTQTELAEGTSSHADRKNKDKYLPDPLSPSDYKQLVNLLQVTDDDQFVVDTLYQAYRDNYDKTLYKPLSDEPQIDANQQSQQPQEEIDVEELRQQRIADLQEFDERLLDDVSMVIKSDQQIDTLKRMRLLRSRTVYRKQVQAYTPSWRGQQPTVDLVQLLLKSEIDGLEINGLNSIFSSYESQTLPLLAERLEITIESVKRFESMQRASQANASTAVSQSMMEKWQEMQQTLAKNLLQISQISDDHLQQIKAQLPKNISMQLQYTYNEKVYPDMFAASKNVDRTIKAALSMPNISTAQQQQIDAIAENFHNKYLKLAEQGITLRRQQDNDRSNFSMGFPSHEMIMREVNKEHLELEQDETCQRAYMQLQLALGATQNKALKEISKWQ